MDVNAALETKIFGAPYSVRPYYFRMYKGRMVTRPDGYRIISAENCSEFEGDLRFRTWNDAKRHIDRHLDARTRSEGPRSRPFQSWKQWWYTTDRRRPVPPTNAS